MIRTLAAAGGLSLAALAPIGLAGSAAAQTWGQPVYVTPYGGRVGGTPLSELETRSYVTTGRWADGYADQPRVHVPAPAYASRYGHGRVDGGYGHSRYARRPHPGYRDAWGYDDDRPAAAHGWSRERRSGRDCGCGDVYLYDR
ncbi:MAG: hypothetical protein KKG14_10830 [Alphaproteobacteria bacterium]|nr:hypothetical protein [Alphaproteobacteria bacterium]MBU2272057.1 hypothetical protein [Alphaproteobacteria bacterium]MBU2419185.1 hypothetical protein [Alphaproteobacteria bacterium]